MIEPTTTAKNRRESPSGELNVRALSCRTAQCSPVTLQLSHITSIATTVIIMLTESQTFFATVAGTVKCLSFTSQGMCTFAEGFQEYNISILYRPNCIPMGQGSNT